MILKKPTARNFRLLEAFDLDLYADVSVLVGPNNSARLNGVDVIRCIDHAIKHTIQNTYYERMGHLPLFPEGQRNLTRLDGEGGP